MTAALSKRTPFPYVEAFAALVVVAGFIAIAYIQGQERRAAMPHVDTQSSYDAAPGGYRALYDLLRIEGLRVEQFERHAANLDGSVDVLIVSDAVFVLPAAEVEAISGWVKAGGTLLLVGRDYRADPALKMVSITSAAKAGDRARPVIAMPFTAGLHAIEGTSADRIMFAGAQRQMPVVADRYGMVAAAYRLGKGTVVAIADPTLFQNRNLAKADNARFAFDLVTSNAGPRAVVAFEEFSHGHQVEDTVWSVLPTPARAGLAVVLLALLALLIATFFRFGPVVPQPNDDERTSAEYLSSMAALLARGSATRKALRDVADTAIRGLAQSLGFHDNAPVALLVARLRGRPGGEDPADALLELNRLRSYEYPKDAELLAAARIAAMLRKEYASHARIGFGRRTAPAKRSA